jgi:hypothetical protein
MTMASVNALAKLSAVPKMAPSFLAVVMEGVFAEAGKDVLGCSERRAVSKFAVVARELDRWPAARASELWPCTGVWHPAEHSVEITRLESLSCRRCSFHAAQPKRSPAFAQSAPGDERPHTFGRVEADRFDRPCRAETVTVDKRQAHDGLRPHRVFENRPDSRFHCDAVGHRHPEAVE